MIAGVKAEIQTKHLNTSLEGYYRTSLLDNYKVRKRKIISKNFIGYSYMLFFQRRICGLIRGWEEE
jgi:hypothetical protein